MDWAPIWQLILHADQGVGAAVAQYGTLVYLLLFAIVYCEIGLPPLFFLPGDPLLFICGAFCATHLIQLWLLFPLLLLAAWLGSMTSYGLGRWLGRKLHERNYRWLDPHALSQAQRFYARYGGLTFLFSLYVAVVRTFAPLLGGAAGMPFRHFALSSLLGSALWVGGLLLAGFYLGNIPFVHAHLQLLVLLGLALGLGGLSLNAALRALKGRRTSGL
ncbi:SNARE-associated domain-containing protein [Chitinimonas naiadis]